jgi:hypothetical protein
VLLQKNFNFRISGNLNLFTFLPIVDAFWPEAFLLPFLLPAVELFVPGLPPFAFEVPEE